MYAIIATGGKQYKVSAGDIVYVEKLGAEAGSVYQFDQILAVGGETLTVGNPTVEGAVVEASVIGDVKGKKVIVYKYKRKSGYHKKQGHRQQYTKVKIEKIAFGDEVDEADAVPAVAEESPAEAVEEVVVTAEETAEIVSETANAADEAADAVEEAAEIAEEAVEASEE